MDSAEKTLLLPPALLPPLHYYKAMAGHTRVMIDHTMRYNKRHKHVHRTTIADVRGRLDLTIPVSVQPHARTWHDVRLSTHGKWWHTHLVTLDSAYGRTPYYEHYRHLFAPFFDSEVCERWDSVAQYDAALHRLVMRLLDIDTEIFFEPDAMSGRMVDLRQADPTGTLGIDVRPYYQVRAHRLGWLPGLSVLDAIFNLGLEASVW